ncbi:endonuclease/exonuclease/phosphatase family protein [Sedimentitalea todarodis]|uniref:Endonuclease/exonuclease/phosphatase family protein n=1 Tax=Sedimentitalea todarodis TaxID=1631240 RepID=A0ABU3VLB0_9RHOB|nr:endonuclease/exonuclease/phosphatase family protein [Sedimentitalea todarodis]MDU9006956.1 endonuclease/exonuclease/phosphatase family protein [Sedimentitalea todarodis]
MIVLSLCAIYQGYRIFPFTQWATAEIALSPGISEDVHVSLISANVLMENTHHDAVVDLIGQEAPDVLFLMETDQVWVNALEPVLDSYETVLRHPLDNHYGLIFATNLPAQSVETVFLSHDETPTLLAELEGPTGRFFFVGLHPRPPVPGQDTEERDAQIKRAAQVADRERLPVVAMGDFNDVAWSHTSERFKEYGGFKDPRMGRGMLPSFDAKSWWMRFPIDQLYLTDRLALISFDRLSAVGSDHFPMRAVIAVEDHGAR